MASCGPSLAGRSWEAKAEVAFSCEATDQIEILAWGKVSTLLVDCGVHRKDLDLEAREVGTKELMHPMMAVSLSAPATEHVQHIKVSSAVRLNDDRDTSSRVRDSSKVPGKLRGQELGCLG